MGPIEVVALEYQGIQLVLHELLASWHLCFQQVPFSSGQENQGVQDSNLSLARSIAIVLVTTPTWLIGWSVWGWQK